MAKQRTKEAPAETAATPSNPSLTIQGLTFQMSTPYSEGHPLTANEASALNNLRGENLRNNFAAKIKAVLEPKDGPQRTADQLSQEEKDNLTGLFAEYDRNYVLSGKRTAKAPADPVEKEAIRMAKEIVDGALRKRGIEKKALAEGAYDGYISGLLNARPEIRDEARAYVERIRNAGEAISGDDIIPAAA